MINYLCLLIVTSFISELGYTANFPRIDNLHPKFEFIDSDCSGKEDTRIEYRFVYFLNDWLTSIYKMDNSGNFSFLYRKEIEVIDPANNRVFVRTVSSVARAITECQVYEIDSISRRVKKYYAKQDCSLLGATVVHSYSFNSLGKYIDFQSFQSSNGAVNWSAPEVSINYNYNSAGQLNSETSTSVSSSTELVTHYNYDFQGRLILVESFDPNFLMRRSETHYVYDGDGNLERVFSVSTLFGNPTYYGVVKKYDYDETRLTKTEYEFASPSDLTPKYVTTVTYDPIGRPIKERLEIGSNSYCKRYEY